MIIESEGSKLMSTTVGVIGAGRIGRMHAENLVHHIPEASVRAVASPHLDEGWAKELGIPVRTTDTDVILGDSEIEAVVIAASSGLHIELIRRAAEAGKHIFCEKPVAFEPGPIEEILRIAADAGIQLQVGFNRRFDPSLLKASEAVRRGEIGDVHTIRVTNRDPTPPDIDFVKRSGGLFFDFTVHDFDTVRFLSGSEIVELFAVGEVLIDPRIGAAGDIDTAVITLRLANGALAVIDNSRHAVYGQDQRFEVFGSAGSVAVDNTRATFMTTSTSNGVFTERLHGSFGDRYREAFVAELRGFLSSVREDRPVAVGAEDALAAVRAAHAARQSLAENRPIRLSEAIKTVEAVGAGSSR
jgi:myo-inositol 2-dehydrogenase/D-chiro-inositol 1-dehydrogenase